MSTFVNSTSSSSFQHEAQFHHISNTTGRAHPFADNQHLQDLWNGEQLPNDATRRIPSTVDVVITFCRTDFTSYLDDFDNFLPPEVQRIEFKVFSKCGNEDMIRTKLNEKLKTGLVHNISFTIESVVNKGGCDLSIVQYINQFFQNTRSYSVAKDKVIFFLKDGNRTRANFHAGNGSWRDLAEMWNFTSYGRFICGMKLDEVKRYRLTNRNENLRKVHKWRNVRQSMYFRPAYLEKFLITEYSRYNDPSHVVSGLNFTLGYHNLRDFMEKELNTRFPKMKPVEVCYGGTFAVPGFLLHARKKKWREKTAAIERLLLENNDMTIIEHFLERLWAWILSNQMRCSDIDSFKALTNATTRTGAYAQVWDEPPRVWPAHGP